jgi:hypothetical protein
LNSSATGEGTAGNPAATVAPAGGAGLARMPWHARKAPTGRGVERWASRRATRGRGRRRRRPAVNQGRRITPVAEEQGRQSRGGQSAGRKKEVN